MRRHVRVRDRGGVSDNVDNTLRRSMPELLKTDQKTRGKKGEKTGDRSLFAPFKRLPKIGRKDSWAKRLAENPW